MTALLVALAIVVVGGAATLGYLRSVRGKPKSVSADIQRFQTSLDALKPRSDERPDAPKPRSDERPGGVEPRSDERPDADAGTMGDPADEDG